LKKGRTDAIHCNNFNFTEYEARSDRSFYNKRFGLKTTDKANMLKQQMIHKCYDVADICVRSWNAGVHSKWCSKTKKEIKGSMIKLQST